MGERSTWVWIAVITVSHERMAICIHFYIGIFSDSFHQVLHKSNTLVQAFSFNFFGSKGFTLNFAQRELHFCARFK